MPRRKKEKETKDTNEAVEVRIKNKNPLELYNAKWGRNFLVKNKEEREIQLKKDFIFENKPE